MQKLARRGNVRSGTGVVGVPKGLRLRPRSVRTWWIGILVLVGLIGLPTIGLLATDHLLRQTDEHRARDSNALAATAVAYQVAQSYEQRMQVFRDLPGRPSLAVGLTDGNRSLLSSSLSTALHDGAFCRLVLRSPRMVPVVVSGTGPCWLPPPPSAAGQGVRSFGPHILHEAAFTGLVVSGAVPGHPAASLQAVFAVRSLTPAALPGNGSRATVVDGLVVVSSSDPALVGKVVTAPGARALIRAGRPGSNTIYGTLVHAELIEAFRPVPGTGLGVFFSVTTKVAYAPADHASRVLLVGYLLLLAVALGLAALVVVMLRRRDRARDAAARQYRSLAEATPDGVSIVDQDGRLLYANPALLAMIGAQGTETWHGRPSSDWTEIPAAAAAERRAAVIERHEALPDPKMYLRHTDGHRIAVEVNAAPFDLDGGPGIISVIRDLTESRAVDAAVALAEARQRAIIATVAEGIVVYDVDGTGRPVPVFMNPAAAELSGNDFDEVQKMSASRAGPELIDTDGRPIHLDALPVAIAARTGESSTAVFGKRRDDGRQIWLRTAACPIRGPDGSVAGIVNSLVDITAERAARTDAEAEQARYAALAVAARQSEQALRESEERFTLAFDSSPLGMALIGLDGRCEQANRACSVTGYSDFELRDTAIADITHPDDLAADLAAMAQLIAGEVTTYTLEKRYLPPGGGTVWVSKTASLVCREDGSPLKIFAHIVDITERKEHEQALADERRRLRTAQAIGHVGSWERDLAKDTTSWSDTLFDLYGIDRHSFAGNFASAIHCVHPEDRDRVATALTGCVETGQAAHVRYRLIRQSDGVLRWFDARAEAIYEDGRVARIGGAVADVTEQVQVEAKWEEARDAALEASRHKSAFLATMSHEIRTPMNAVIGMTGLLLDSPLDSDQRELLEIVRSSGDALLGIINDILDFSKIEAGGLRLERRSFDLGDCVGDALDLVAATSGAGAVELVGHVDPRCPTQVVGDVTRLRQVLVNLVGNAVKFTSEGEVLLSVEPAEVGSGQLGVRFAVTDTGIGIPAERLASLFDSFSQVDASTTRLYGGTGLGLAISQRLVKAMGGVLEVESVSGAGSCFHFSVALAGAAGAAGAAGVGSDRSRGELAGRAVLVVDDNATNRRILRAQLEGWGMAVSEAADGPAALALAAPGGSGGAGRFDVAVLDMKMPGMSGQDLAVALRAAPATAGTALVLLGSRGERAALDRHDLFAAVLSKPVRAARLHQCLRQALGDHDAAPAATVTAAAAGGTGMRVLLAEDNVVNQRLGRLMLEKLGHRVDIVGNGAEAAQAVHLVPYDAVLMDVEMPVMDGLEATRVIRAEVPARRQPRIVALTASALVEDRQACANAGMDDYLSKPVRLHDLDAALKRATPTAAAS